MKKVLIISYFFPPRPTIGSQRAYKLAKYFPEFGWEPIVLTAKLQGNPPQNVRIIETEYKDIIKEMKSKLGFNKEIGIHEQMGIPVKSKNFNHPTLRSKIIKLFKEIIAFPDENKGWYEFAVKTASEFLFNEKVDVMISTSSPVTSHLIAKKLKQKYKIPWIADLRDLWTQNHFYNKFALIKNIEKRLELKTLSRADILVTVTNRFAESLKSLHKDKKVFCITNGYDTDDFQKIPTKLTNNFTITYTGELYNGKRAPYLLFEAVAQLLSENKINRDLIEIRFLGHEEDWLIDMVKKYKLEGIVNYYGFISRKEALEKQKESQLLLLLLDRNNKEEDVYPAKVFEYFGARRPIIAIGGDRGIIKDLLEITNAGKFASSTNILKNALLQYYQEFIESGAVKCDCNSNINNYSYYSIAKKYSEKLNELILN